MAVDEEYTAALAVTMTSLLDHLRASVGVDLFLMDAGLRPETRTRLEASWGARVRLIPIAVDEEKLDRVLANRRPDSPAAVHVRALMASSLPEDTNKVLYLDSDLLIQRDLEELWFQPMGGHTVLAVQDSFVQVMPAWCPPVHENGRGALPYFNSGVMVIDLASWRSDDLEQRYTEALARHRGRTRWPDQDALNSVLVGRWSPLPPVWNKQFALGLLPDWRCSPYDEQEFGAALRDPAIIHFCTHTKPWHAFCDHPNDDVAAFRALLRRAGFGDRHEEPPSWRRRTTEWFAAPHRRLLDTVAVVYRARDKQHAWETLRLRILTLAAWHPWTLISVPLAILRDRLVTRLS